VEGPQVDVHVPEVGTVKPQITVESPRVDVHVDADLHLPDETIETETMIERDKDGLIKRTKKTSKKKTQ